MTSPLPPLGHVFQSSETPTQLPGHLSFEVQPHDDHRLHLPVSVFGKGSEADADHAVLFRQLRDEVRITVLRPFIENEYWRARGSGFADDGAHRKLAGSMQ